MEVAQVMVVNKADLAGADTAVAQLRALLALANLQAWEPPILKTVARANEGIEELADAIDRHQEHVRSAEHSEEERRRHVRGQIIDLARAALHREALEAAEQTGTLAALVDEVAARERDPRSAALELLAAVRRAWASGAGDDA
jgi:LAO/AO transport system kinase